METPIPDIGMGVYYLEYCFFQFLGNGQHGLFICLVHFPVVGEEAVDLVLHIGNLGDDGGTKAFLCGGNYLLPVELIDGFPKVGFALAGLIAIGIAGVEQMAFYRIGIAAEFAEDQGFIGHL